MRDSHERHEPLKASTQAGRPCKNVIVEFLDDIEKRARTNDIEDGANATAADELVQALPCES
jgi:hypothetical protein